MSNYRNHSAMEWVLLVGFVILFISLVGCGGGETTVRNVERVTTTKVEIPKPVACFKEEDLPVRPKPTWVDAETASIEQLAAAAAADRESLKDYADAVDKAWAACKKVSPK